ncbi:MAG: RES family NAD+ phosphorylase [Rhodobacterales bacterium]
MLSREGRFQERLFRALNPAYTRAPLSGRGAALYGGRFNTKGTEALYTALDPITALREAHQVGDLQPTTLVSYKADLGSVFDTRDDTSLAAFGLDATDLADRGWRATMMDGRLVRTQDLGKAFMAVGGRLIGERFCTGRERGEPQYGSLALEYARKQAGCDR